MFVTVILFLFSYNVFLPHDNVYLLVFYLFLCSVGAGYISYQCYSFAKTWAVPLISAWAGLGIGLILIKLTFITNGTLTLLFGIFSSYAGAYFGRKLNLIVRSCGTAICGSYLIIKGLNFYFGGLPPDLFAGEDVFNGEEDTLFYVYFVTFVVIAIQGWRYQMKTIKPKSDDDYNYKQDEGCCC